MLSRLRTGMLGWEITELARSSSATNLMPKAMDTTGFLASFVKAVLPHLRPYPQHNSVLICDNATLHHDQQGILEQLVESVGAKIFYLPPYACDLNPIEKVRRTYPSHAAPPHPSSLLLTLACAGLRPHQAAHPGRR